MSVDATIIVWDADGWDAELRPPTSERGTQVRTIRTRRSDTVFYIASQIVTARTQMTSLTADSRVKLTILAHSYDPTGRGDFGIQVGTGLSLSNLTELEPLAALGFYKIISRACGPLAPAFSDIPRAVGGSGSEAPRLLAMRRFYLEMAARTGTRVIGAHQQQMVQTEMRDHMMSTLDWIGPRTEYSPPDSSRSSSSRTRTILPRHEDE